MINFLLTIFLASIFVLDWLFFVMGVGGRMMTWIPEFVALILLISLPFKTAVDKNVRIPLKYGLLLFFYLVHILFGFLLNDITTWTMLAGLRIYFKFIPIFIVPIIYPFTEKAFRNLLLWIYALTMVQLPVVLWQKFVQFASHTGGDRMGGTLGVSTSGVLAIFLISIISFLIAFYYKDEISFPVFIISFVVAFIPITLNETKISIALLPVAFVFPAFFIRGKRDIIIKVLLTVTLMLFALIVFTTIYDYYAQRAKRDGLTEFVTDRQEFQEYSETRLGPLRTAFTVAPKKDLRFAFFGRGAGNVSKGFTPILSGKYLREASFYDIEMTFPKLMWEIGILGTILFFLFPAFVFFDAVKVSREKGMSGAYGLGMLTFTVFFMLSTAYTYTIDSNILIFLYFFAGGQLVHLANETQEEYTEDRLVGFAES